MKAEITFIAFILMVSTVEPLHLLTIDNNIDVSIEVKIYSETLLRLRNKDLRHAFRFSKKIAPTV